MAIAVLFYTLMALSHCVKKLKNMKSSWLLPVGGQGQEQSKTKLFFWSSWRGCVLTVEAQCKPEECRIRIKTSEVQKLPGL